MSLRPRIFGEEDRDEDINKEEVKENALGAMCTFRAQIMVLKYHFPPKSQGLGKWQIPDLGWKHTG